MEKMTMREFLMAITEGSTVTAELETFAKEQIEKLDEKLAKRKTAPASIKKQAELDELVAKVKAFLETQTEPVPASVVAKKVTTDEIEVSTPKATALLKKLVESGEAIGETGKVDTRKTTLYSIVKTN